jgi:hypothetical protein
MPRYTFGGYGYEEEFLEEENIYESDYYNERPKRKKTRGPFYDVKHFCSSWGKCCQDNLDLRPKHPMIQDEMTSEQALQVFDAFSNILYGTRQIYGGYWSEDVEVCAKDIIRTKENGKILIKALNNCKCCKKHQTRRATSLADKCWETTVKQKFTGELEVWCACPCRHNTRIIQEFIK